MHPLAHHAGEDSLVPLLLLGGAWLPVLVAYSRERLASVLRALGFNRSAPSVRTSTGVSGGGGGRP